MDVLNEPRPRLRWAIFCTIYEPTEILILGVVDNEIDAVRVVSQHYHECDLMFIQAVERAGNTPPPQLLHLNHVFMIPCPEDYLYEEMRSDSYDHWQATGFDFDRNLYVAPEYGEIPKSWAVTA